MLDRFETALDRAIERITANDCPPRLADAIRYAVEPPAHRLRPRLVYAVAAAIGEELPDVTDGTAVALEMLHCASLVQDDLPVFDAAVERRGRPALHLVYGDAMAILVSDALILGAFEVLALGTAGVPLRGSDLTLLFARATGAPRGAVAGQAWEEEPSVHLERYHAAKTAALFEAATMAGAVAAGAVAEPWCELGRNIGMAYQLADDIADTEDATLPGSDASLGKPNAALLNGVQESRAGLDRYARAALRSIPLCRGQHELSRLIHEMLTVFREAQADVPVVARSIAMASEAGP
jgi:geranylgeranyl diphosphate synthase type II